MVAAYLIPPAAVRLGTCMDVRRSCGGPRSHGSQSFPSSPTTVPGLTQGEPPKRSCFASPSHYDNDVFRKLGIRFCFARDTVPAETLALRRLDEGCDMDSANRATFEPGGIGGSHRPVKPMLRSDIPARGVLRFHAGGNRRRSVDDGL